MLVSGFGRWGGGIYDLTDGTPRAIDDIPTSGLAVGGGRLWRVLRAPGELTTTCELLSYDARGLCSYQRLDPIRDPHDVCWHDGAVHITSSWDSAIWRVEPDGARPVWRGGSVPDSWHVNSLTVVDGRLHVCAFGRFDGYKAWKSDAGGASGFVHDVERGVDVLTGLDHPHTPRRHGDRWYVCESARGLLTELDAAGRRLRRTTIKRFSRGLAIVGDRAFVGGNAHRDSEDDRAEIAVVDLSRFAVVDTIAMPSLEIYDIVAVPPDLVRGLRVGLATNPSRAVEQHRRAERTPDRRSTPDDAHLQLATPRAAAALARAGQPLHRSVTRRCAVTGDPPTLMRSGEVQPIKVTVENRSDQPLASVSPRPIRVGACWFRSDDQPLRNPLAPLPGLLHPGETATVEILVEAPAEPGDYNLVLGLHQSGTGWFGETPGAAVTVN